MGQSYFSYDSTSIDYDGSTFLGLRYKEARSFHLIVGQDYKATSFELPFRKYDYIYHLPASHLFEYAISGLKVSEFSIQIRRTNGSIENYNQAKRERKRMRLGADYRFNFYDFFAINHGQLEPGDTLICNYRIEAPFPSNVNELNPCICFLDNEYPTNHSILEITHDNAFEFEFQFYPDVKFTKKDIGSTIKRRWESTNTKGGLDIPNIQHWKELPCVTSTLIDEYDLGDLDFILPGDPVIEFGQEKPPSWHNQFFPSPRMMAALQDAQIKPELGRLTPRILALNKLKDTLNLDYAITRDKSEQLRPMIELVNKFDYVINQDFYVSLQNWRPSLDKQLRNWKIQEMDRLDLYVSLLESIQADYWVGFLEDNRQFNSIASLSKLGRYGETVFAVVNEEGGFNYFIPKKDRFGWHMDEFPFYHEGTELHLYHASDLLKADTSQVDTIVNIPITDRKVNNRKVEYVFDFTQKEAQAKCDVQLSGQFSTMFRWAYDYTGLQGIYLNRYQQPQLSGVYRLPVTLDLSNTYSWSTKTIMGEKEHPFKTSYRSTFGLSDPSQYLSKGSKNQPLTIPFQNLFPHILSDTEFSQGNYLHHFDFAGQDQIELKFLLKDGQKLKGVPSTFKVECPNFQYDWVVKRDGNEVTIQSTLIISESVLPRSRSENIYELGRKLAELRSSIISISK